MSEKVEFEKWKSEKYRKERALDGGMWDSGHNSGLETGLFLALEYSELVNAHLEERLKEAEHCIQLGRLLPGTNRFYKRSDEYLEKYNVGE